MKIAVFIKATTFHSGFGGFETQNKVLCEGLVSRGHIVHIFSPKRELQITEIESVGVLYHFIDSKFKMLFSGSDKNSWENRSVTYFKTLNASENFDVAISQSTGGIGIIKHKKELNIKILGISHGTIGGELKTVLMNAHNPKDLGRSIPAITYGIVNFFSRQRTYARGVDKLVAVSTYVKKAVLEETYVPDTKVTVIHNGIDKTKFAGLSGAISPEKKDSKVDLLYLGRIEPSKGIKELLLAVKDIKEARLNVVGDGPILEAMKLLVRDLKISNRVIFYGKLPYDKALEMYTCSQIFVLPSKRIEGLPMVLVEAMFAKLALVASNIGGNSDVVEDGYNGFLVESGNIKELTYKLRILCEDKKLTEEMGKNGRIKAQSNFTLEHMLTNYESVLRKLVA